MYAAQVIAVSILLIASFLGKNQGCASSSNERMHRLKFVLFGDSLTQRSFDDGGWGARLTSAYQRKV